MTEPKFHMEMVSEIQAFLLPSILIFLEREKKKKLQILTFLEKTEM